jgi:hypothetical protein
MTEDLNSQLYLIIFFYGFLPKNLAALHTDNCFIFFFFNIKFWRLTKLQNNFLKLMCL